MEKIEEIKNIEKLKEKQPNKLEIIQEDIVKKTSELIKLKDPLSRNFDLKNEESCGKFKEKIKELWSDFAVHGIFRFNEEEKKMELLSFSDLDGKTSLGLLELAGFDVNKVKYVAPGESVLDSVNIDTGGQTGIVASKDGKTIWFDHHGDKATKKTVSAARYVYLALTALGFLRKNETLDKLTQFVSRTDRAAYPRQDELFLKSDKTILGLRRFLDFPRLYDYFSQKRSPEEELKDEDLKKYNLEQKSKQQTGIIKRTKEVLGEFEKEGMIIDSDFGKIVVDVGGKLPSGYEGSLALGYDGYMIFNPKTQSYFISIKNADLSKLDLSQGVNIRGNMWIKPQDEKELKISLREIVDKLGGKLRENSKLRYINRSLEMRSKEFVVRPEKSHDKKGNPSWITKELGKISLFPPEFNPEEGRKYIVKIKGDTALGEKRGVYFLEVLRMDN